MDFSNLLGILPLLLIIALLLGAVAAAYSGKSVLKTIVFCAVGIILIGSLLVPALSISSTDAQVKDWQFDDYRAINATDADGAFEIVTVDDVKYVHAVDLGEGSYKVNGKTITETVTKADLDVVLILGQSNAAYRSTSDPSTASPVPELGKGYYYGTAEGAIFTSHANVAAGTYDFDGYGIYDMINSSGENVLGNIESPFAATYDGRKVLTINAAVSGTSTSYWVDGGYCYTYAKECIASALALVDNTKFNVTPVATLWIQGEADTFMTVSQYVSNVHALYEDLQSGEFVEGLNFDKFLISMTRNGYNANTAQKQLAADYEGIYIATDIAQSFTIENGKMLSDDLHYSQKGDNELGVAFGKCLNRLT